jgi:hypothetical protein
MHHTSGLRDQWELVSMAGWRMDDVITREHILKMVNRQRELNFKPGAQHVYCNTGYTLLAEIVAKVSGKSFPAFTDERIFKPLGMSRTHFHDDHERIVPGRAYSYSFDDDAKGYKNSVLSYANVGATSLFTTAEDLCRWLTNLDDGRVGGTDAINEMHQRGVAGGKSIDYALGLVHSKHRGLEMVQHSGGDAGFRTYAMRVPQHKLGIVVLSNLGSFNPSKAAHQVAEILLAEHLDAPAESAAEPQSVSVDPTLLERHVGVYRLDVGALVKVTRSGDQLLGEMEGVPRFRMVARSPKEFFVKELGAQVAFEQSGEEPSSALTASVEGQSIRGTRLPALEKGDFGALAGTYYSPELDTSYTIEVCDDGLVAHHQRHSDITLKPFGPDEFAGSQWFMGVVKFDRKDGQVEGFRVSGGRVRNLRFERRKSEP